MKQIQFKVDRDELEAAMLFAVQDDPMRDLSSVLAELRPGFFPLLVATDGRAIIAVECIRGKEVDGCESLDLRIPLGMLRELTAAMRRARQKDATVSVRWEINLGGSRNIAAWFYSKSGSTFKLEVDTDQQKYPSWRQCVPTEAPAGTSLKRCVDPALVAKLAVVTKLLAPIHRRAGVTLWAADQLSPIHCTCYGLPFWATIMPMRDDENLSTSLPAFLKKERGAKPQEPAK